MLKGPSARFLLAIVGIVLVTVAGMLGYMTIEGYSPIDALYMSVITVSTVGYGEVHPLDTAGRVFTIVLIVTGVGTVLYLLTSIGELIIEGRLREQLGATAMQRRIHHLKGHVIICGFGRFGRVVAEELIANSVEIVIIEPDAAKESTLARLAAPYIMGSALDDAILTEAGVATARALVAAIGSDADNVYVTLAAREKNATLSIHARGESESGLRRLRQAGADQVVSAYQRGGNRVAAMILRPAVVDFLELATPGRGDEVDLEEIKVQPGSRLLGRKIGEIERDSPRLRIVALKRGDKTSLIPDTAMEVQVGDYLVAIGERASLSRLAEGVST
ncbi:MAG TPA: potassium channel protein [Candidatus Binataceae bacterium]|nr:potassium channel protein [Candidatus Binataceae bacterium]